MEATSLEAIKHQLDCSRAQIRQMDEGVAQVRAGGWAVLGSRAGVAPATVACAILPSLPGFFISIPP
jgi:hypothetical protein